MKVTRERASDTDVVTVCVDTMRDEVKNIVIVAHRMEEICSLSTGSAKKNFA